MFRQTSFFLGFVLLGLSGSAQESIDKFRYTDAHSLSVTGRAFNYPNSFHRLDSADRQFLIPAVRSLATNSSGVQVNFRTNARAIKVEWQLARPGRLLNMTPIGESGVDLYGMKNGKWQFVATGRPAALKNNVLLVDNLPGNFTEFKLYLPLYNELQSLKIGVPDTAVISKPVIPQTAKRVVIYGSSITQGASASRAGMAYPAILDRKLNIETINLGFSGNGTMEMEIVDVLARIPADVYILDCVPNPSPEMINERAYDFVNKLRKLKPGVPIIMVESIFREGGYWDQQIGDRTSQQNREFRNAYLKAVKNDRRNLHYIFSKDLIGGDHEATIDGVHLTDLGFIRIAETIGKKLSKIL